MQRISIALSALISREQYLIILLVDPKQIKCIKIFNVVTFQSLLLFCFQTFSDPSLTDYELAKQKAIIAKNKDVTIPTETETILLMIETFRNATHHEA